MRRLLLVCLVLTLLTVIVTAADKSPISNLPLEKGTVPLWSTAVLDLPDFDTITTQCGISLVVSPNGNMGRFWSGLGNLGFPQPLPECYKRLISQTCRCRSLI